MKAKIILGISLGAILLGMVGYTQTHYTRVGKVVDNTDGVVTVVDTTQNIWEYEGSANINDRVKMKMFTNGTDTIITDDVIENVKVF